MVNRLIRLATLLFGLGIPLSAYAAQDLSVTSVSGASGSTVSVSVIADSIQAVNSMQFNLHYDPNLLAVSNVTAGSADTSWMVVKNTATAGTMTVGMFNTGGSASAVSGSARQVAVIQFNVKNPPQSAATSSGLTLSSVTLDSTSISQLTPGTFTLNVSYTLTVNTTGNGTVNESPSSSTYAAGAQVALTAVPSSGYQFSGWTDGPGGSNNPLTLTMNADTSVTATFTQIDTSGTNSPQPTSDNTTSNTNTSTGNNNVSSSALSITQQPSNATVTAPATATFTVEATGAANLSYQWQKSSDNGSTWESISGATGASYTTPGTSANDNGTEFDCVVTNSAGSVTSQAVTLSVSVAPMGPSITAQPTGQTVTAPATATISVAATGNPAPNYQWMLSTDGGATFININAATGASYTTAATTVSNNGNKFKCVVSNTAGTVTSNVVALTVNPALIAPSITTQPMNQTVTALAIANFSVSANGTPAPSYQWQQSTNSGTTWGTINGATSALYTTGSTTISNNGTEFECVVSNTAGNVTSNAVTLTVTASPAAVSGACGTANKTYAYGLTGYGSDTFCAVGTPYPSSIPFPKSGRSIGWTCEGANNGFNKTCSAKQKPNFFFRFL